MQRESMGLGSPTSTLIRNGLPSTRRSAFGNDDGASDLDSNVQDGRKTEMSINVHSVMVSIESHLNFWIFVRLSHGLKRRTVSTNLVLRIPQVRVMSRLILVLRLATKALCLTLGPVAEHLPGMLGRYVAIGLT